MMRSTKIFAAALLCAGLLVTTAQAEVILSSYSAAANDQTGMVFTVSDARWEAVGFVTGPGGAYSIDSVTMRLSAVTGAEVQVSVFDSVDRPRPCFCSFAAPGVSLGSLGSEIVSAKGDYTFSASSSISLAPSTLYWIVFKGASASVANYYEYKYPGDPWYSPFQSDNGSRIFDFSTSPGMGSWINGVYTPGKLGEDWTLHSGLNLIQINGTSVAQPVPEPLPSSMLLFGLAVVAFARRKK